MKILRASRTCVLWMGAAFFVALVGGAASAQETSDEKPATAQPAQPDAEAKSTLVRLDKESKVWIDPQRKLVVVEGKVVLREGQLEMFACPGSTKSHESVVSVDALAFVIHAGLLAVGAKPGKPVQFAPEYVPASGTEVDIHVLWVDDKGARHKAKAQDWIRQTSTGKVMPYNWVFAGSGFWVDPQTGEKHYQAEDGDLICVSNFATATLDLPVESSQSGDALLFEAFTENIPPLGTKVRLVLVPKLEAAPPAAGQGEEPEKKTAEEESAPADPTDEPTAKSGD